MSVVITPESVLGPFKQIEVLADRLSCDGSELPFTVIGSYQISEDDSLAPVPVPVVDEVALAAEVRTERNKKLVESDWTQMADSPLSGGQKSDWALYRQSLRDITSQPGFPHDVTWPTEP